MSSSTIFVLGANRGIGKGLVAAYLAVPGTTVIAGVRSPSHPTSQLLNELAKGEGSGLIIQQVDAGSSKSISDAIDSITRSHGIQNLDVVISNAGVGEPVDKLATTPLPLIQQYIDVNSFGPLLLFQSTLPLLRKSRSPKFVAITSLAGSFTAVNGILPIAAYGASKALANYFVKYLAVENPDIITWAIHPGFVATDMGIAGMEKLAKLGIDLGGLENLAKPLSVDESALGIKKVIDEATKEKTNGQFLGHDGGQLPW